MDPYFIKLYVKIYINNFEERDHIIRLAKRQGKQDKEIDIFINDSWVFLNIARWGSLECPSGS